MHQVLRPPTELKAIILSSQSSHSLLPGAGIISMPFNSIIITRYTGYISHQETLLGSGYFPKLSFGDKIITRLSSKILLMHGWIVILQDISDGRIIPRVSTPSIANCTFFWQCPHSLNHKKLLIPVSFAEKIGSYLILVASPLIQNGSLPISRFKLPPRSLPNLTESLFCRRQLRSQFTSPEKCSPFSSIHSVVSSQRKFPSETNVD